MPRLLIDNIQTPFINISDITDSLSANESSFTVEVLNYSTTTRLGKQVEVYGSTNILRAIGNVRKESVSIGVRRKSSLEVVGYSQFLDWYPITGRYKGTIRNIIDLLLIAAKLDSIIIATRFLTNDEAPNVEVSLSLDHQYLSGALQQLLALSGYPLQYRIPVSEKVLEIFQPNYGNPAPIANINLADLYTNCGIGLQRPIQYTVIPPLASKILIYGRNGLRSIGNGGVLPLDIISYTSKGETQFKSLETADELIKVLVTQPTPAPAGCTVSTVISGTNYDQRNLADDQQFYVPVDKTTPVPASELIYSAIMEGVKPTSVLSIIQTQGTVIGSAPVNLEAKIDSITVLSTIIDGSNYRKVITVDLSSYADQTINIEVRVFLDPQASGTINDFRGYISASCCRMDLAVGIPSSSGFNGDGLDALATTVSNAQDMKKLSTGELVFCDPALRRIRKIQLDGTVVTIGGNGSNSPQPTNGIATSKAIGSVFRIWIYNDEIYFCVNSWNQIGKIKTNGDYEIIYDDFANTHNWYAICLDSTGNIYYSDQRSSKRFINKLVSGSPIVYAGTGSSGFSGDGGAATSANIGDVYALCVDADDNLYLGADNGTVSNDTVRKVDKNTGIITTVAGKSVSGGSYAFDSTATDFKLSDPFGISIRDNILYILDNFVGAMAVDLTTSILSRVAGVNGGSDLDETVGAPLAMSLGVSPGNIWAEPNSENIYIADRQSFTIKKILCGDLPCTYSIDMEDGFFEVEGGSGSFDIVTGDDCEWSVEVDQSWVHITSATSGTGSTTITFTVDENETGLDRVAIFTLRDGNENIVDTEDIDQDDGGEGA